MDRHLTQRAMFGGLLLVAGAALALCTALAYYLVPHNGIDHTEGALLVVVSSALILAAAVVARWLAKGWPATVLHVLIFLGIIGTGLAAYFLEGMVLELLMAVALIGWLLIVGPGKWMPAREGARA